MSGRDKQVAWGISLGVHVVIFGLLAAGGLFSFLHSRALPVDVAVYNEDAISMQDSGNAPAAGGETYAVPDVPMPQISETYTEAAREERDVQQIMASQHVDEGTAKQLAAAKQTGTAVQGANTAQAGSGTAASGTGNDPGDGTGSEGSGHDGNAGRRPAKKAQLVSVPDASSFYPESLRKKNISGTVKVHVTISADGTVASAELAESSGFAEMDDAAVRLAYQCRYEPAENEYGEPVAAERNMAIPFTLE